MVPWLLALPISASACDDPEPLLADLEQAALEGRYDDAEAVSDALIAAFGCGTLADPAWIARMWLAEAVLLTGIGELEASEDALAAAARLSPSTWLPDYGSALEARWRDAAARPLGDPGRLIVDPLPPDRRAAVDGAWVELPTPLPAGLHLLQIGVPETGAISTARLLSLSSGLDLVVDPGLGSEPPPPITHRRSRRVLHALAIGVGSGALYGVTFGTRAAWLSQPEGQRSDALAAVNDGLVIGAIGAGLASGTLLVRGLTTAPDPSP